MARYLAMAALALGVLRCGSSQDPREATLRSAFARADEALLAERPALVAGRYALMATGLQPYYRGSLAIFLRDWRDPAVGLSASRFAVDAPLVLGVGDPHVENFGALLGRDGTVALETNDLDGADRLPYLWDLRRLTVGLCVAALASNPDDDAAHRVTAAAARDIARSAAAAYAEAITPGAPELRVTDGGDAPLLVDLFRRANRDAPHHVELTNLTTLDAAGHRRLLRGTPDPTTPTGIFHDLPAWAYASLPALFTRYRASLTAPPEPAFFTVLDAVREFGSGVASWPRVRLLVVLRGDTDAADDDVIVEVKEQTDSTVPGGPPPNVWFDDDPSRVAAARRTIWSRPDAEPLWGTTTWFGLPLQVRRESEGNKGVKVANLTGAMGTPDAMRALARVLGAMLARSHRRSLPTPTPQALAIARDPQGFADEQADVSVAYATRVAADWALFQDLLRRDGPTLGFAPLGTDGPSAPVRALFTPAR